MLLAQHLFELGVFARYYRIPGKLSIGMGVLMLVQSLGQFLGTWLVPMLLGPDMSVWMFTGIVTCVIGIVGTIALAFCKFK